MATQVDHSLVNKIKLSPCIKVVLFEINHYSYQDEAFSPLQVH